MAASSSSSEIPQYEEDCVDDRFKDDDVVSSGRDDELVNITMRDDDNLENENDDGSGGPAGNALLQSQVRVRRPVQHGHPPPHQHPQDHAGESDQGNKTQMWVVVRQAVGGWHPLRGDRGRCWRVRGQMLNDARTSALRL